MEASLHPYERGTRHFGLFDRTATGPETDPAATRPDILAPMQAALEKWMDEKVETPLEEIFQ